MRSLSRNYNDKNQLNNEIVEDKNKFFNKLLIKRLNYKIKK